MRLIAYLRVSKADRLREERLGLEAQRAAILSAAERNGWEIVGWYEDDGVSGKSTDRPGLQSALAALRSRKGRVADGLVAAKLDRLSRSVMDFGDLLALSARQRWAIAVLDFNLDTSSATGRLIAGMLIGIAQWEREIIGERTAAALAVKRSEGVQLGKPSTVPAEVEALVLSRRAQGVSLSGIARLLNAEGVPTPGGSAQRTHVAVGRVVQRAALAEEAA
ncbi:Site-specific DNA recombinase [Rathayibacter oskolensis]|uniref:Site-specific DNA recombinase n=1 Tax=Rathayibacter oskolensis TaxID=1891671 RepID=A0A1X7N1I9_9MICO|nr:recombinase family protein [Rathayibacter oskolensis]SMH30653.1 Site-specific DNA recombinase [Rathayibacter oskolensis]